MKPIITLLTDFGTKDPFVAEMKAVILSINPEVVIVDISHEVKKFDVKQGAFLLTCAYKYFPRGTVHVVVIDPGVGTERRGVVIRSRNYYFVGPDNGVLLMAALDDGIVEIYEIRNKRYTLELISTTFHGRDVFAPVAAYITKGIPLNEIGPKLNILDLVKPSYVEVKVYNGVIEGEVVYVDSFGNVITNIRSKHLKKLNIGYGELVHIEIPSKNLKLTLPLVPSYGYVKLGSDLCLVNSHDFFELATNQGNFSSKYGIDIGDKVLIKVMSRHQ